MSLDYVNDIEPIALVLLSAGLGSVTTYALARRKESLKLSAELEHRIRELEKTSSLMSQAVIPINSAMQALLIKELTHIHTPEMDALLVKVGPPNTLTPEEEERLAVLLKERAEDMAPEIPDSERGAALILPTIMERAKEEMALTVEAMKVKLVAIASQSLSDAEKDIQDKLHTVAPSLDVIKHPEGDE